MVQAHSRKEVINYLDSEKEEEKTFCFDLISGQRFLLEQPTTKTKIGKLYNSHFKLENSQTYVGNVQLTVDYGGIH